MIYQILKNEHKYARLVKNREEFLALRNSHENLENLAKARAGDEKAKAKLVQFAYNLGVLSGSALAGCKSIGSYFFHDVDCYDAEQSAAMAQQILAKKDEIGLMMLEQSASGGWHLVCKRIPGTTILENQVRIASILQIEMDTNAHDLQRVVYSTSGSSDDLLYLDDTLFDEPMIEQECEAEYVRLKDRERKGEEQVPAGAKKARKHYKPWTEFLATDNRTNRSDSAAENPTEEKILKSCSPLQREFRGIPYSDIIAEWWRQNDGLPQEGERNVKLYQLAVNLRAICDNNRDLLLQIMPRLGLGDDEVRSIVDSACKESPKGISKAMNNVLDSLQQEVKPNSDSDDSTPPVMPVRLPKLINLLTKNTPNQYKAAVAHAVFPPLGTHLKEVEFEYTDYVLHEATLMNCLMAHTGAGKGCIDEPIRHIMADIKARDAENTRREAEWKKDCQKKGANKDKLMRPAGLVIQEIDPDMTKPALVTRMDEAEGHFVYVKLNEIDLFEQLKGQTGKQHFQLMCLAFDPGAEFGQTRIGTQSVTARPKCRFNWNACTTIQKGRRFFSRVLTDGPISRINFCTIPEMEIGAEQPIYGKYDAAFDAELKTYIDNLTSAHGVVDCPQAFKLAKKLQEECAEFARLSQDETYWNLSHRAIVIAWLKACVLYVANGCQWEKSIEAFIRWSLQYDLWCKMQFFGADIEAANSLGERIANRGPRNLLELLPDEFTLDDARRVRKQQGKDEQKTIFMIRNWMNRNYVIQNSEFSFEKSYKYKSKNNK
ncbi:hypothetical protein SAMN04488494_0116 [Xylanibacter ruminicola]|uniref:VirE N-terminal domain-containing protein n=1 Tax=Xylanibacter ruminicola TaxID=839 RepID=A0A1M7NM32_XYLRU|nr:hypothetical protein [Xylanibacter ruminicola]SHN04966.1 hypothetical protein SAMN04488494_0116 [Xylanibacter ruminicola]